MASTCPTCGASYDDTLAFCTADGTRLVREVAPVGPTPMPVPAPVPPVMAAPAPPVVVAASPDRTGLLLGALGALAVVLTITVVFLLMREDPAPVPADIVAETTGSGQTETDRNVGGVTLDEATSADETMEEILEVDEAESLERVPPPDTRELVVRAPAPAPPPRAVASYGPASVRTDQTGLLLRSGPGRNYDVIGKMEPGDVVMVEGCDGNSPGRRWCQITYGGLRGYTLDEFLAIGAPQSDTDSGLEKAFAASDLINSGAYIDGSEVDYVNLRTRPFVGSDVLVRLRPRADMFVVRCLPPGWSLGGRSITGRWCFVNARQDGRNIHGWASDGALRW